MVDTDSVDYKRLVWHSRRGMLELDLLLESFVLQRFPELDKQGQRAYRALLDCEDQELFNWFLKKEPVRDPALHNIVEAVLDYQKQSGG